MEEARKEVIQEALSQGRVVVCDRFFDATTVYQGFARGLDMNTINQYNCSWLVSIRVGPRRPESRPTSAWVFSTRLPLTPSPRPGRGGG